MDNTYNKAGRPTNTERINKNRDEITDNEAAIAKLQKSLQGTDAIVATLEVKVAECKESIEREEKFSRKMLSDFRETADRLVARTAENMDAVEKHSNRMDDIGFRIDDETKKLREDIAGARSTFQNAAMPLQAILEEMKKSFDSTGADVALLGLRADKLERESKENNRDVKSLADVGANQYDGFYKAYTKTKSDYEVHSYILIGLGVLSVANLALMIWKLLG